MQTRKLTLAQCRESLNMLMQDVDEGRNDRNSVMYRCPLGKDYISEDAELLRDPARFVPSIPTFPARKSFHQ